MELQRGESVNCLSLARQSELDVQGKEVLMDATRTPASLLVALVWVLLAQRFLQNNMQALSQLFSDPGKKREPLFGKTILVGQPPKKRGKKGATEQLSCGSQLTLKDWACCLDLLRRPLGQLGSQLSCSSCERVGQKLGLPWAWLWQISLPCSLLIPIQVVDSLGITGFAEALFPPMVINTAF